MRMCLPNKSNQTSNSSVASRSIMGLGALVLLACVGGPLLAGVVGALGVGVLVGAGGALFALVLCLAVPAIAVAWRRRSSRSEARIEL